MKVETNSSKPGLTMAVKRAILEIHFAAAFPVEFVIRRLEDVPLRMRKTEVELPPLTAQPSVITHQEL
jgi:hypothetical protein